MNALVGTRTLRKAHWFICGFLVATTAPASFAAESRQFGVMPDGRAVYQYTLRNRSGTEAQVLSLGATLRALNLRARDGKYVDVVLGYDSVGEYLAGPAYFGATIGRYAGRIANAKYSMGGRTYQLNANNGANSLHGGAKGFNRALWTRDGRGKGGDSVRLKYVSPDGEEGFPGELTVWVTYTLTNSNELQIAYEARASASTVANFTNHSYFNLRGAGEGDVLDQIVYVDADVYLPTTSMDVPTGDLLPVQGTDFDLREPASLAARLASPRDPRLARSGGYDVTLVLNPSGNATHRIARVEDHRTGLAMDVSTTEPAMQLFTPRFPMERLFGKGGKDYGGAAAVCLETQHFPDSPNNPQFPTTALVPGQVFRSETIYGFSRLP